MEALTINNLAPYLPFGLKYQSEHIEGKRIYTIHGINSKYNTVYSDCDYKWSYINGIKIILFPLSDLTKPITINGETFVPILKLIEEFDKMFGIHTQRKSAALTDLQQIGEPATETLRWFCIQNLPKWALDKLFEWKFAINLPEGSWIDVNSLEENPYK